MNEPNRIIVPPSEAGAQPVTIGRYVLHRQIARGGMATIHIARLMGDEGFCRIVAAKRLHPEFAEDAEFVAMFLDEARIASRVHHRNVVPVLDVVNTGDEVILVQEYVHGAPLQWLLRSAQKSQGSIPVNVAVAIGCQVLAGLHATHETVDEMGQPMGIVHRDVSPQNVMVAMDGSARLLDFGVAKAVVAAHVTREGMYKGKLAYSAPEHIRGTATRQSDVYSLSVLLWELLVGQRMHGTKTGAELVANVMNGNLPTIREALASDGSWGAISAADRRQLLLLDPIVRKGLAIDLQERWATALEMEEAIVAVARPASERVVAAWLQSAGKEFLEKREGLIAAEEASWRRVHPVQSGHTSLAAPLNSSVRMRVPGAPAETSAKLAIGSLQRFKSKGSLALLCGFAGALAVHWAWSDESAPQVTSLRVAPAAAVRVEGLVSPAGPAPIAEEPKNTTHLSAAPEVPKDSPKPTPVIRVAAPREAQVRRAPQVKARPLVVEASQPPVASSPAASAPPVAASANDCSTPYYFEGSKKVFKSDCL